MFIFFLICVKCILVSQFVLRLHRKLHTASFDSYHDDIAHLNLKLKILKR